MGSKTDDLDLEKPKIGRFDEAEVHRWETLFLSARGRRGGSSPAFLESTNRPKKLNLAPLLSESALDARILKINLHDGSKGEEVIVKSTNGPPKTIGAVRELIHYIARLDSTGDRKADLKLVLILDGYGREFAPKDLTTELAKWNLFSNRENLSKKAREAKALGDSRAIREMGARARYRNVQTWHFIWSIHAGDDPDLNTERLRAAALVTIERQFTERGHRVLWGIHRDKEGEGRLHAHVVVEALARNGDRIRCDKYGDYLYSMRVELASNLRATGLDYIATRREDRFFLRQKILSGNEPLRRNLSMAQIKAGGGVLSQRVPQWWSRFGEEALDNWERAKKQERGLVTALSATRLGEGIRNRHLKKDRSRVNPPYQPIFDELLDVFRDPFDALGLWHLMAREGGHLTGDGATEHPNRRLAIWFLVNRPETFGHLRGSGRTLKTNIKLRRLLQRVALPIPKDDHDHRGVAGTPMDRGTTVLNFSRIQRDRNKVKASLLRVARIAEDRGRRQSVVEDIRLRVRNDLKHVQIGSVPSFPTRRAAHGRPIRQGQQHDVSIAKPDAIQDRSVMSPSTGNQPAKVTKRRFDRGR